MHGSAMTLRPARQVFGLRLREARHERLVLRCNAVRVAPIPTDPPHRWHGFTNSVRGCPLIWDWRLAPSLRRKIHRKQTLPRSSLRSDQNNASEEKSVRSNLAD